MNKLLVILGPTAIGKTDLALSLAKKFNGELISCDSRQVYIGLDIGTGKISSKLESLKVEDGKWIVDGVVIHMYDVINPDKQYTVADYVKDADRVIGEIRERGKLPIVVGGTGLYLKALLYGLSNLLISVDKKLRSKLQKLSLNQLQESLKKTDFKRWKSLNESDSQNPRRLIRAIELGTSPRSPYGHLRGVSASYKYILKIGLTASRTVLYNRVDERVVTRISKGMIDEAINLHDGGLTLKRMRQLGLEYGILADYLDGKIRDIHGDGGIIKIMQNKIHGYVRRQITWFRKEKDVNWFDITDKKYNTMVENVVAKWYYPS